MVTKQAGVFLSSGSWCYIEALPPTMGVGKGEQPGGWGKVSCSWFVCNFSCPLSCSAPVLPN